MNKSLTEEAIGTVGEQPKAAQKVADVRIYWELPGWHFTLQTANWPNWHAAAIQKQGLNQ
jgi:hypothetical protein